MSDKPAFVISDVHLGAVPIDTEQSFRRFLKSLHQDASELLINGDLFDFWFEYGSVIQARHYRVLAALKDLRESGVRIRFTGGNHDAWGGPFLRDELGIELLEEGSEIHLAGKRSLVVHGDGVGRGDLGYKVLKKLIRNRVSTTAFRLLHPDLGSSIARLVSTTEMKAGNAAGVNPTRAAALREWACGILEERPDLDLVLTGHTHTPTVEECRPGGYYVNTGDWINHFTYLKLERSRPPKLLTWEDG